MSDDQHSLPQTHFCVQVSSLGQSDAPFGLEIAEEVPVRLGFNGLYPYGVTMMTPDDLEDFALGYCLTEQIIDRPDQLRAVAITRAEDGLAMEVTIAGEALARLIRAAPRARTSHTSCGICGDDAIPSAEEMAQYGVLPAGPMISIKAIRRALDGLGDWQKLNGLTRMVHAAAWADQNGEIRMIREDVGRHNALDKLIGARAREAADIPGFCVLTSRYSYEMALKSLRAGMSVVVAISAPTARACRLAQSVNQTLIGIARRDQQVLFCGEARVVP